MDNTPRADVPATAIRPRFYRGFPEGIASARFVRAPFAIDASQSEQSRAHRF
jgi:hypothetical protein